MLCPMMILLTQAPGELPPYKFLSELVIKNFRQNTSDLSPIITPEEFARFLLNEARENRTHTFGKWFTPDSSSLSMS